MPVKRMRAPLVPLSATIALLFSPLVHAETQGQETILPKVEVEGDAGPATPLATRQEQGYRVKHSAVTGYREQAVLDTPFSSASIPAEVMQDQQTRSLVGVAKNDPSVAPAADPLWYDRINVRGFYLGVDATFRDGLGINDQGNIALDNKAAVEINKGLSALRYGATSPGGTVNYVVKRPTVKPLRNVNGFVEGTGSTGIHADLSDRFGQERQFGYRINVSGEEQRSHVDAFTGDRQFVSGLLDWHVSEALVLELDVEHQRQEKLSVNAPSIWWWSTIEQARAAFDRLQPDTYAYQNWAMEPNEQTYVTARASWQLHRDWKVNLAAMRSKLWRDQNAGDVMLMLDDTGEYDASIYYSPDQSRNNRAVQLVFEGLLRQGKARHELAFGYDSIRRDMTWSDGVYTSIGTDNLYNPRGVARPPLTVADAGSSYLANRTDQRGWFVTDNLILNDQWRVFAGLRHTSLEQYGADSADSALVRQYDQSAINPALALVFKPAPSASVYASYAEGIQLGEQVSGATYSNNGEMLEPLESQQYEIGAKWEFASDALLTAALFHIDKGLIMDRANGDGSLTRVQDGRQVHRGLETTLAGQITPSLRLLGGLAWLDAQVEKTDDVTLIGKRPQGIPEWQANLYADYAANQWLKGLSLNAGVYYGGRKPIDSANTWMADSYVRFDAGARLEQNMTGGRLVVWRLLVENLTDERYLANTTWGSLQFGAPLTVKASVNFNF